MKEGLNYNFAIELNKEKLMINGLDYFLKPGLHNLIHLSRKDIEEMVLDEQNESDKYLLTLTIKKLLD